MNVAANVREQIGTLVAEALQQARFAGVLSFERDVQADDVTVERPKDRAYGDWATNIALVLAKEARTSPRTVAEALVDNLNTTGTFVAKAEVAGPGFVNFHVTDTWRPHVVRTVLERGAGYGRTDGGSGKRVLVEFVSANPTGPLNVVSARHATVGDVLCNVLTASGYDVSREFYVNDAGNQVRMLSIAVDVRMRQLQGEDVQLPEGAYPGEYVIPVAQKFLDERGTDARPTGLPPWIVSAKGDGTMDDGAAETADETAYDAWLDELARFAVAEFVAEQKDVLREFRLEFDRWFHETEVRDAGGPEAVVRRLQEAGHTYEKDGALWLKSTDFGDNDDRVLVKGDGEFTYFVPDTAYHITKVERGYDILIDLLGRDHYGYHVRLHASLAALGHDPHMLEAMYLQLVHLVRAGEEVRMSKRRGEFVTMREFLDEVSVDAARWFFLMRSTDVELDFDLDLANMQTSDNPVYYVQYAHARIVSLFKQAAEAGVASADVSAAEERRAALAKAAIDRLQAREERALIDTLAEFADEIELAAERREPHRIPRYAHEVAAAFHSFYTHCRVLGDDEELTGARLALCEATRTVLANALELLGIDAPEAM